MDNVVFASYFHEGPATEKSVDGRNWILYVDNCYGNRFTEEVKNSSAKANTELRKLLPISTDKVQPADQLIISKIKAAYKVRWEKNMAEKI